MRVRSVVERYGGIPILPGVLQSTGLEVAVEVALAPTPIPVISLGILFCFYYNITIRNPKTNNILIKGLRRLQIPELPKIRSTN